MSYVIQACRASRVYRNLLKHQSNLGTQLVLGQIISTLNCIPTKTARQAPIRHGRKTCYSTAQPLPPSYRYPRRGCSVLLDSKLLATFRLPLPPSIAAQTNDRISMQHPSSDHALPA